MKMNGAERKLEANLENWCLVLYSKIYENKDSPENAFAILDSKHGEVVLFGRAKDDPRYNPETQAFADGNRLVTGPVTKVENGKFHTLDTIYPSLSKSLFIIL